MDGLRFTLHACNSRESPSIDMLQVLMENRRGQDIVLKEDTNGWTAFNLACNCDSPDIDMLRFLVTRRTRMDGLQFVLLATVIVPVFICCGSL